MSIQYGPIRTWPGKLKRIRANSPFKAGYNDTIRLLEHELAVAGARSPVVQLAVPFQYWRNDGRPYADAKFDHPGVILSFTKVIAGRSLPLSFPCDTYHTWLANLRAIALALEALRKVDRYGVTQNAEQYTGFRALPPAGPDHVDIATVEDAARFLAKFSAQRLSVLDILGRAESFRDVYRDAAATLHPDANEGVQSPEWAKLQAAKTLLDQLHNNRGAAV